MDYLAQLLTRDRHGQFMREADEARVGRLAGLRRRAGKPAPRNQQATTFREVK